MEKQTGSKIVTVVIAVLAVAMVVYHLVSTQYLLQPPIAHQNTHLAFALVLVFLSTLKRRGKLWPIILVLILLALVSTGYVRFFYRDLEIRAGVPTTADIIIGLIIVFVCIEATRQAFGWTFPIIVSIFIAYTFLGHHLPDPLWHFPHGVSEIVSMYDIGLTGMYGMILGVSVNYIFLFILFGALLRASGATNFYMEVGTLAGRKLAGGPAMTAMVSSALVGTVTGAGTANVGITGPFTIPLMKKVGYTSAQAGAIEAVASSGGAIMPPVMGAVAFIMAGFLDVPYIMVCGMAIIPAILYYLCLTLFVQLNAMKLKVYSTPEKVDVRKILTSAPLFVVPLLVLTAILVQGYSAMYAAFWAIVSLVIVSLVRKETRGSFRTWLNGITEGAVAGAQIGVTCGILGVIVASISMTGLGLKFPGMVEGLSGGNLMIALVLVAMVTVILGCGVPPSAAYILVALLGVPALVRMGVGLIQAHFFVFFFAVFSLITPPIAMSCLIASAIAGSNFWKTSFEAIRAGAIAFLLPFVVIWAPIIILQPQEPLLAATNLIACFVTVLGLQLLLVGHYLAELNLAERGASGLLVALLITYIVTQNYVFLAAGLMLCILITLWQLRKRRLLTTAQ